MSPLLRPVGPLPASVYWVRRALALALIGLATWLLISVLPFGKSGSGDAAPPAATNQPSAPDRPVTTASPRPSASTSAKPQPKPTAKPKPKPNPKPAGTPICPDSVVSIAADAKNSKSAAGKPVLIEVELENTASVACRVSVSAKSLEVTVTSGEDRIWTTEHCTTAINPGPFTLQPGKVRTLGIVWMGQRSKKGCPAGEQKSLPGFYAVDASFNGIAAKKGHFLLD